MKFRPSSIISDLLTVSGTPRTMALRRRHRAKIASISSSQGKPHAARSLPRNRFLMTSSLGMTCPVIGQMSDRLIRDLDFRLFRRDIS
jgi:hypothetical protein